ncbi:MAG: protein-disulfide reductase DsbD domain-containing protein [Blastocatellia bacterium]
MKSRIALFGFILLVGLSATAAAQTSASVIKLRPEQSSYRVKAGAATPVVLVVEISDGYHINSNRPADKNLVATALKFDKLAGLSVSPVIYPRAKTQKFEFSPKPLSVYEGRATFKMTARALATAAAGQQTLKGKLTVQACNNQLCLRPQTVDVAIPIEVVK